MLLARQNGIDCALISIPCKSAIKIKHCVSNGSDTHNFNAGRIFVKFLIAILSNVYVVFDRLNERDERFPSTIKEWQRLSNKMKHRTKKNAISLVFN